MKECAGPRIDHGTAACEADTLLTELLHPVGIRIAMRNSNILPLISILVRL